MRATTIHAPRRHPLRGRARPDHRGSPPTPSSRWSRAASAAPTCGPTAARTTSRAGSTIGHECVGVVEEVGSDVIDHQGRRLRDRAVLPLRQHLRALPCRRAVGVRQPRHHPERPGRVRPGRPRPTAASSPTDGMPDDVAHPVAAGPHRRDGDRVARRGRRRRAARAAPSSWSATARSASAASWPRPSSAPSASSRCRATSPARRSPAPSGPPTSSPSAARRAQARIADLTDGVGADAVLECVGTDDVDEARPSPSPARARRSASSACPHGVELPVRRMFQKQRRPRRRHGPGAQATCPTCSTACCPGAIDPGLVFDLTLPLDESAEGYRAMDERRAIKVLLQPMSDPRPTDLLLGPLLRYVDETSASVWVETAAPATVTVTARRGLGDRPDVRGPRPPLRPRRARRPRARHHRGVLPRDRRRPGLAARAGRRSRTPSSPPSRRGVPSTCRSAPAARRSPTTRRGTRPTASTPCARGRCASPARSRPPTRPTPTSTRTGCPTWCSSSATRSTPTRPPTRCGSSSSRGATSSRRPGPSSRTTRSTPTSTGSRGPTPPTGGCCRPCPAR